MEVKGNSWSNGLSNALRMEGFAFENWVETEYHV